MIERTTNKTRTDWRTPNGLIDLVRNIYRGRIDLDPCADRNERYWVAKVNHTGYPRNSGLDVDWFGNVYINPPYGRGKKGIGPWIHKGKIEQDLNHTMAQIWLVPARLDTRWWRELMTFSDCFAIPKGRITFEGANAGAQFPSALVYVGKRGDDFYFQLNDKGWSLYDLL